MNDPTGRPSAEIIALTEAYCNGTLTGDEWARLEQCLLQDAQTRAWFRRYLALDAALHNHGESAAAQWLELELYSSLEPDQARAKPPRWGWVTSWPAIAGAALMLLAGAVLLVTIFGRDPPVIASLAESTGNVRILAADGKALVLSADAQLRPGDQVQTSGSESSTVVAFPDGTRLTLVGNTSITCDEPHSSNFVLHQGTLSAAVQPQPGESPLKLATPTARIEVLGTRFVVEAAADRTDLSVSQGRVRLVRVSDGEAVDVDGGKQATVRPQSKLEVKDIPALADTWDVDFEDRLPDDWELGEHVTQGLPKGSRGAVKAVADQQGGDTFYVIASPHAWSQGLFAVRKNSHLHMTYRMENPDWIQIILVTRTADRNHSRYCANFEFKNFPKAQARQWMTVSIPLAEFQKLHSVPQSLEELVPFKLIVDSTEPDRGLVIDRIWVTPDGPGKITSQLDW